MPSTWARWGIDANGDGVADPDNPDGRDLQRRALPRGLRGAVRHREGGLLLQPLPLVRERGARACRPLRPRRRERRGRRPLLGRPPAAARLGAQADRRVEDPARRGARASREARARGASVPPGGGHRPTSLDSARGAQARRPSRCPPTGGGGARRHGSNGALDTANTRLGRLQDQASNPTFIPGSLAFGAAAGGNSGVVSIALQYLGVPYVWAGATPRGFDCSGLVQYVFGQLGISLPHNTVAQWHDPAAVSVPRDELQPGDLVFFNGLDHVGIYIGSGYFVDAPHTGTDVRIDSLTGWYAARLRRREADPRRSDGRNPAGGRRADVHHSAGWHGFLVQRRLLHPLEGHGP